MKVAQKPTTLYSRQLAAACSSRLGMSYDKHATSSSAWRYRHIPVNRATGTGRREKSRSPQQTSMRWSFGLDSGVPKEAPSMRVPIPPEMLQSHVESCSRHGPEVFRRPQLASSDSAKATVASASLSILRWTFLVMPGIPIDDAHRRLFGRLCSAARSNSSCF